MSRLSFTDAAERIKGSLDIVDIIQRHVMLKKVGRHYKGVCPFHNDKSPSMDVNREKGVFLCRACGVGGGALNFLMRIENKTYGDAIRDLAQEQGIEIESQGYNPEVAAMQRDTRQKIQDLNYASAQWFATQLQNPSAEKVMRYLAGRYPDDNLRQQALSAFQLGYAPDGWENLTPYLKAKFDFVQASPDLLVGAGLSGQREGGPGHYDKFRHRLIIPILDEKGQVVAFGGRSLSDEDKPKYLNSPETAIYKKSQVLYGLYQARDAIRQSRAAIVMEGYFDVISAHLGGIPEAVGSCGTAMTESHLKLLTRFGAETVYLAFDADTAGLKAALSAIALIEPFMAHYPDLQVKVLLPPDGKDPDEFIRQHGGAAFRATLAEARPYLAFKFDMALKEIDPATAEGRIQAANRLTPLLFDIDRPATRAEYVKRYSERIGLSEEALHLEVKRYEQAQNPGFQRLSRDFRKGGQKKAISKGGSPSLWRSENGVPDNLSELRAQLTSRHLAVEKNLLKLALYNLESFRLMMPLLQAPHPLALDDPALNEILLGLRNTHDALAESGLAGSEAKIDPSANGLLGTLIEKMNHLYSERPDILQTFADLVLTAEAFCESLGMGELQGQALRDKVTAMARQQITLLASCRRTRQLQTLRTSAGQENEEKQVDLIYQFQDRFFAEAAAPANHPLPNAETG